MICLYSFSIIVANSIKKTEAEKCFKVLIVKSQADVNL